MELRHTDSYVQWRCNIWDKPFRVTQAEAVGFAESSRTHCIGCQWCGDCRLIWLLSSKCDWIWERAELWRPFSYNLNRYSLQLTDTEVEHTL